MQKLRANARKAATARLQQVYSNHYNVQLVEKSQQDITAWLGEATQPASIGTLFHHAEKETHSTISHRKDTPER